MSFQNSLVSRLKTAFKDPDLRVKVLALAGGKAIGLTLLLTAMSMWLLPGNAPVTGSVSMVSTVTNQRFEPLSKRQVGSVTNGPKRPVVRLIAGAYR